MRICVGVSGQAYTLPELQADVPAAEFSGREQQDTHVCERVSPGGVLF